MTANAVASLSLEPPLVLVAVDKRALTLDYLKKNRCFAVNILRVGPGGALAPLCDAGAERLFGFEDHERGNCLANPGWIASRSSIARSSIFFPGGDHEIFIGEILAGEHHGGEPLLYYAGGYRRLAEP